MRNLYFMFAVLALPLAAFAETNETTGTQTTQTPTLAPKACGKKDKSEKCVEKARKHFENMKVDESHSHSRKTSVSTLYAS